VSPRGQAIAQVVILLVLVVITAAIQGCALFKSPPVEYVPYPVKVKVSEPCAAQLPPEPAYATGKLQKADEIDRKVDAVMAERQQRMGYEEKLRAAVKGCQ
jgi:hypothetical protein